MQLQPGEGGTDLSKKAASRRLSSTLWRVPALTWQFMSWAREMKTEVPLTSSSFSAGSPSSYSFGWQRFPIWLMSSAGSDARSCRDRPPLPPRPPPESWPRSGRASTRSPTTEEGDVFRGKRWMLRACGAFEWRGNIPAAPAFSMLYIVYMLQICRYCSSALSSATSSSSSSSW